MYIVHTYKGRLVQAIFKSKKQREERFVFKPLTKFRMYAFKQMTVSCEYVL